MTHIRVGIADGAYNEAGDKVWYDATPAVEMRPVELTTGVEMVPFTVYRNVCRP